MVVSASDAGIRGPDCSSDGGDFVFGLERHHAEILVHGKFVKNVRCGCDRIGTQKEGKSRLLRRRDKAHGQRLIAAEISIRAGGELGGRNFVADLERFGRFAEVITGAHGHLVGFDQQRLGLELGFNPLVGQVHGAVVEPIGHAQRKEVLAAVHGLGIQTQFRQSRARQALQADREHAVAVQ